jgi:AbrB family looped-hinge helix DNA binding protein
MRITIKGQVTIPQAIRERHGLLPGTEVRFVEEGDVVRIERADQTPTRGRGIVDAMRAAAARRGPPERLTTDEIMALTRAPWDDLPTDDGEEAGAAPADGSDTGGSAEKPGGRPGP